MTRWQRLVVATGNRGKVDEIRAILSDVDAEIVSLDGYPAVDFPAEGADYRDNAVAKARAVAEQLGEVALADDSGLEVDALGGRPGPFSARYGGASLDDRGRCERLLSELVGVPEPRRSARFVCEAALVTPGGDVLGARGECEGTIASALRGSAGFGYDPIFVLESLRRSMAELDAHEKNALSHRALAFRALWRQWSDFQLR